MTTVVNVNRDSYDVFIGRPSKWGNPFMVGKDGSRDDVIRKYAEWIIRQPVLGSLDEVYGKRLGCYCFPKRCHGEILAALADELCSDE